MSQRIAIIVAGGKGQRMNQSLPKQFLVLEGIPVLMRTIHAFHVADPTPLIVVVLAEDFHDFWLNLCHRYQFHVPHYLAPGGLTRFQSVRNGLHFLEENSLLSGDPETSLIAVHDGARPLITADLIEQGYQQAASQAVVTLALPSTDSLRRVDPETGTNSALPRDQVYAVQTPQTFRTSLLLDAYAQEEQAAFTDDVSVAEARGYQVSLLKGDPRNIKITYESDLALAATYLQDR